METVEQVSEVGPLKRAHVAFGSLDVAQDQTTLLWQEEF